MNTPVNERDNEMRNAQGSSDASTSKAKVTHNLDTGEDEALDESLNDKSVMDFGSGSGGGSAGDGGAS